MSQVVTMDQAGRIFLDVVVARSIEPDLRDLQSLARPGDPRVEMP